MKLDDLTIGEAKQLATLFAGSKPAQQPHPLIGKNVILRTVTMIYTGKMIEATDAEFILISAAWIPETERYADFVAEGKVKECEPYPDDLPVYVNRGAMLEACELKKQLPRIQK